MESYSESRNEDGRTDRSRNPAPRRASPLPLFTYARDSGASEVTVPSNTSDFGLPSMPIHEMILSPWLLSLCRDAYSMLRSTPSSSWTGGIYEMGEFCRLGYRGPFRLSKSPRARKPSRG